VRGWIYRHARIGLVAEPGSLLHVHQLDRATLSTECQEPFQQSVRNPFSRVSVTPQQARWRVISASLPDACASGLYASQPTLITI
jgi:hypothetical protein